jgi:hypothetical protein
MSGAKVCERCRCSFIAIPTRNTVLSPAQLVRRFTECSPDVGVTVQDAMSSGTWLAQVVDVMSLAHSLGGVLDADFERLNSTYAVCYIPWLGSYLKTPIYFYIAGRGIPNGFHHIERNDVELALGCYLCGTEVIGRGAIPASHYPSLHDHVSCLFICGPGFGAQ